MVYYVVAMTVTLILCYYQSTTYTLSGGAEARCFKDFRSAFIVLLPLTLLTVFRWDVGVDSLYGYNYWESYHYAREWENVRDFEPGFFLVTALLSQFKLPYWYYLAAFATFFMACYTYAISKGSVWTKWSILVFFMLFCFFDSFSMLRQSSAEAISVIVWANIGYYPQSKNRDVKNILLFLLAATFHTTALINIPLYLISQIHFSRGGLLKFAVFAMLLTPLIQIILSFIMRLIAGDEYEFMGFALINAALAGCVFLMCWYFYDDICSMDENAYKYVNLSLCIFILLLNSGALLLPFRVFDMLKIGYVFIIPYLLRGIRQARVRFSMEVVLVFVLALWFINAYFINDSAYADYQSVFKNFKYYSRLI